MKRIRHERQWEILTRAGRGPLMHFDGKKFTNNGVPKLFRYEHAMMTARDLLKRFAVLKHKGYHVWVRKHASIRRQNPESIGLEQAAKKFHDFTGHEPGKVIKAHVSNEREGLVIGELDLIGYRVKREGVNGGRLVRYGHQFKKSARPLLAVTKDGHQLFIVGGRYEFTEAGIEDR